MTVSRRRLLAAVVVATAALVPGSFALAPVPAAAAGGYCAGAGINVAVDFGGLGGGVQKSCVRTGLSAPAAFSAAGFPLTRVQQFPGAVCRVRNEPAGNSCVNMPPADAYWGLFISHGSGWSFSSSGVDTVHPRSGDTVAFAWQSRSGTRKPAATPATPTAAEPTPTSAATHAGSTHAGSTHHTAKPHASPTTGEGASMPSGSAAKAASQPGKPSSSPGRHHPTLTAGPTSTAAGTGTLAAPSPGADSRDADQGSDDSSGLPWWVPAGIVVALGLAGGAAMWRRRTSTR